MNSFNPLVSIVIPVYNGSNYLAEAIDSALAQTYSNIEVLVINDGSKDNDATRNIALSYGNKIRYFEKENGGVATALNLGIKEMKGEYFSWLSHDDIFLPEKTLTQIKYALEVDASFSYTDYQYIDESGLLLNTKSDVELLSNSGSIFYQFLIGYPIHGCTVLIRKQVFNEVGYFDELLPTTQDYDFWFRISIKYQLFYLNKKTIYSRLHKDQGSLLFSNRHFECDVLYTKIVWYLIRDNNLMRLSEEQLKESILSLINRNYLSSAFMGMHRQQKLSFILFVNYRIMKYTLKNCCRKVIYYLKKQKNIFY